MEAPPRPEDLPASLDADICIVGAGPAGLVLADRLVARGATVVVLESGRAGAEDPAAQALNDGEQGEPPRLDLQGSRHRGIGGTAQIWNMAAHGAWGAKYLPLDARDFAPHPYIPHSGWPFDRAVLEAYYPEAERICLIHDAAVLSPPPRPPLRGAALRHESYWFGRATPFVATLPARLSASPRARLLPGATAAECEISPSGTVRRLSWRGPAGESGTVRARTFVLAAGGLENARLLLHFTAGAGLTGAPGTEWIGRGLMEHPIDRGLVLTTKCEEFRRAPSWFEPLDAGSGRAMIGRIALAPALLDVEQLPNASVSILEPAPPAALRHEGARSVARRMVPIQAARR